MMSIDRRGGFQPPLKRGEKTRNDGGWIHRYESGAVQSA